MRIRYQLNKIHLKYINVIFYMHVSVSDCIYSNQERNLINTTNFIAFMFLSVYSSKYVSKLM